MFRYSIYIKTVLMHEVSRYSCTPTAIYNNKNFNFPTEREPTYINPDRAFKVSEIFKEVFFTSFTPVNFCG